jgi:hypothetical protein
MTSTGNQALIQLPIIIILYFNCSRLERQNSLEKLQKIKEYILKPNVPWPIALEKANYKGEWS